ncbi:flagella basal body P-ring formation protein FlgA [Saccharobesus litoralis]|uniref:Flagella basal body P-ring formation protein FlgA n=1 Tax=Saccharobesus litoralis TaxID=2172099 RepID=A0A2S0VV33_9ALTE|nr:flagellar basal body P-ring formation chaperone FlgA [Saccharobesus litoralis]AWB67960.1 flagella basal body P-ring formation protein FlgA [Saccharobesus litoralis]
MIRFSLTIFLFCFYCIKPANAVLYSKDQIQTLASQHAESVYPKQQGENVTGVATSIDPRIKIKPCESELSMTAPNVSGYSRNLTVRVRCLDSAGWSLYVPVQMKVLVPILVASQTIGKGDILDSSSMKLAMLDKSYARKNSLSDLEQVIGAKAKQQILPGQAIMNNNLCFVCKNELVTIQANTKGLTVKASGYALSDGSFGDVIRVRNSSSNRIINARVSDIGKVQINL